MIANRASVGSESDDDFLAAARLAAAAAAARRLNAARFAAALRLARARRFAAAPAAGFGLGFGFAPPRYTDVAGAGFVWAFVLAPAGSASAVATRAHVRATA